MFSLGWNRDDLKRALWTFVQAGVAAALVALAGQSEIPNDWDGLKEAGVVLAVAFVAGVVSAIKNAVLADGSALK